MHAHFAERGTSPAEFFTRLSIHHLASATSSRGSLDRDRDERERERTSSPKLSTTSSPHPPVAYQVLSSFKRSRASLTPDPTHSNSSVSLAAAPQPQSQPKATNGIPEGNIIRRKPSTILIRQREPQRTNAHLREHPQSTSSISSSCANSPLSPGSQMPQSDSLRSPQVAAAAAVVATGNSSNSSSASRAARVDPSAATSSSFRRCWRCRCDDRPAGLRYNGTGYCCADDRFAGQQDAQDDDDNEARAWRRVQGLERRELLHPVKEGGKKM